MAPTRRPCAGRTCHGTAMPDRYPVPAERDVPEFRVNEMHVVDTYEKAIAIGLGHDFALLIEERARNPQPAVSYYEVRVDQRGRMLLDDRERLWSEPESPSLE